MEESQLTSRSRYGGREAGDGRFAQVAVVVVLVAETVSSKWCSVILSSLQVAISVRTRLGRDTDRA